MGTQVALPAGLSQIEAASSERTTGLTSDEWVDAFVKACRCRSRRPLRACQGLTVVWGTQDVVA